MIENGSNTENEKKKIENGKEKGARIMREDRSAREGQQKNDEKGNEEK